MTNTTENTEKIKQDYINDLYTDFRYGIEKFDTQALYLSSGALAISLTFIKDIVPIKEAVYLYLFYTALILFTLTITIGFIAHFISTRQIMARIKKVEQDEFTVHDNDWISRINKLIIFTLIAGIALLVTFTMINMNAVNKKENKINDIQSILIEEGVVNVYIK